MHFMAFGLSVSSQADQGVSVDKNENCDINTMAITGIPDTNTGLRSRYVVSHN